MEKIKLKNIKTKVEKEVVKMFASDYLGTKEWELVKKETKYEIPKNNFVKEKKEEK